MRGVWRFRWTSRLRGARGDEVLRRGSAGSKLRRHASRRGMRDECRGSERRSSVPCVAQRDGQPAPQVIAPHLARTTHQHELISHLPKNSQRVNVLRQRKKRCSECTLTFNPCCGLSIEPTLMIARARARRGRRSVTDAWSGDSWKSMEHAWRACCSSIGWRAQFCACAARREAAMSDVCQRIWRHVPRTHESVEEQLAVAHPRL